MKQIERGASHSAAFGCPANCPPDESQALKDYIAITKVILKLRGWEPDWYTSAQWLTGVSVIASTVETGGPQPLSTEIRWRKSGGAEQGTLAGPYGDRFEWVLTAGMQWSRHGEGPWKKSGVGRPNGLLGLALPLSRVIEIAWDATPTSMSRRMGGGLEIWFVLNGGRGRMKWEVDEGRNVIERITTWDSSGRPDWTETRTYTTIQGRTVLAGRERQRGPGTSKETMVWTTESSPVEPPADPEAGR